VIPTTTIDRVVETVLSVRRVAQGWLGVSLHPVSVPAALDAGTAAGLMVMALAANGTGKKQACYQATSC
jgi:S1-C subfamily serine protease